MIRAGDIVRLRTRQYLVQDVGPTVAGQDTRVRLSCLDDDAQGQPLEVLWESEVDAEAVTARSWAAAAAKGFDPPRRFAAWLLAQRWNCVTATDARLLQAPWRAGIEVNDYQLEPLRKALLLPRVNLFIADDVGLGKTIEAALIVRELLLRQKVRRVVVACPPSVVWQWRAELESRFGLNFQVFDRDWVRQARQERGFGVNPWKMHNAFIVSHALLRDESYLEPMRDWLENRQPYPGSLLILDEAHNAAPASGSKYAIDSRLTQTVREVAPLFEHRLFLSATPHNGHSNSFSALLEMLDPQRFCRGVPVKGAKQLDEVMVRRLKSDLVAMNAGEFPQREVVALSLDGVPAAGAELRLPALLDEYRDLREQRLKSSKATRTQLAAGLLVVTSLQKRLLSSVDAFARTLAAHRRTLEKRAAKAESPADLSLLAQAPGPDDDAAETMTADELNQAELLQMERATAASLDVPTPAEIALLDEMKRLAESERHLPDAKVRRLIESIRASCFDDAGKWNRRRVLVFTEYVDTLRYLQQRLNEAFSGPDLSGRIETFEGGAAQTAKREELKRAFNTDPWLHPLRILIATDAAREGVNLQNHCADLFHFDVPWNPARMEQRNGRIDRKLQRAATVRCHYFVYAQRPEDRVLEVLVKKSKRIHEELGSLAQVVDERLGRRMSASGIRRADIDTLSKELEDEGPGDERATVEEELEAARLDALHDQLKRLKAMKEEARRHLGVSAEALRLALNESLELLGAPALEVQGFSRENGRELWRFPDLMRVAHAGPGWRETLDTLRRPRAAGERLFDWRDSAPLRPVIFEDAGTLDDDTVHLHLEQRAVQRLLGRFVSQGFVHDDLSRICALVSKEKVPRVVLIGRLTLHGRDAARLHDELVHVTAPWVEPAKRAGPLKPYAATAESATLAQLEAALVDEQARAPSAQTQRLLATAAAADVEQLEVELLRRSAEAEEAARKALHARGDREAAALVSLLESQKKRIEQALANKQLELDLKSDTERRQLQGERAHQRKRLDELAAELESEPKRVRATYEVHAKRTEVLGLLYLLPESAGTP